MPTSSRSSVTESVITHTAPVQRKDRLEWSGRLASDHELEVDISFTWLGGRYRPTARPWLLAFLTAAMRSTRGRLLGSGRRPLWHDGAAHDKLDKVLAIAHDPAVAANLRVCWVGKQQDRNCGHCFKCLMTPACFWLAASPARSVRHPRRPDRDRGAGPDEGRVQADAGAAHADRGHDARSRRVGRGARHGHPG